MTRKEAINELEYAKAMCKFNPTTGEVRFRNEEDKRQHEAFDMAIRSLEAWEKVKNDLVDLWLKGYSQHTEVMEVMWRMYCFVSDVCNTLNM